MSAKELKDQELYKKISISPDLTPNERLALKHEIDECARLNTEMAEDSPYYWGIRRGMMWKLDLKTKRFYKENTTEQS